MLHSFDHLGEEKVSPEEARGLIRRLQTRLTDNGYAVSETMRRGARVP